MANWKDLTPELRYQIIYFFCEIVILEFADLATDPWDPKHRHQHRLECRNPYDEGPKSPLILRQYSSVILISKYFYRTINSIRIKYKFVNEILQLIQFRRLKQIAKGSRAKCRKRDLRWETLDLTITLVGSWWRNLFIIADLNFVGDFFEN